MPDRNDILKLLQKAWKARYEDDPENAWELARSAEEMCQPDNFELLGRVYHVYMQLEADRENLEKAVKYSKRSVDYYKKSSIPDRIAHSVRHQADLQFRLGHYEDSKSHYLEALSIYRDLKSTSALDLANALAGYATLLQRTHKLKEAIFMWIEVKQLYEKLNLADGISIAENELQKMRED